jgi:hypothetical protein
MRVALLLHFEEEDTPLLFIEMSELIKNEKSNEWRESSRWIKFEEDVEGDWTRWSKPHVATLSLPSITELRYIFVFFFTLSISGTHSASCCVS